MSESIKDIPVRKYPYERFILAWDFTNDFEAGEAIDLPNCTASAVDKNGSNVTSSFLELSTLSKLINKLLIVCRSGVVASSPYYVSMKCQSDKGYKYQGVITVNMI